MKRGVLVPSLSFIYVMPMGKTLEPSTIQT